MANASVSRGLPEGESTLSAGEPITEASPRAGLPTSAMQEQFSVAFVHMVASAAGCSLRRHDTDYDGVDLTIHYSADYDYYSEAQFDLQLKCTTQQSLLRKEHLAWNLSADRFERLTKSKRMNPRYLGVLLVPDDPTLWLEQDEGQLLTRSSMYWEKAVNLGSLATGAASKSVHLPRGNLFDVSGLLGIMRSIGEGGSE